MRYRVTVEDQEFEVEVSESSHGTTVKLGSYEVDADLALVNAPLLYSLLLSGHSYELLVEVAGSDYAVFLDTELYEVKVQSERELRLARLRGFGGWARTGEIELKAPMPGLVSAVLVQLGDEVANGQGLVILEAMKMENEIRATKKGLVKRIAVVPGQKVNKGDVMVVIE